MDNVPGTLIRKWRKQRGLTQEKLAEISGISVATLERWESGKVTPQIKGVALVLAALNVPKLDRSIARAQLDRGRSKKEEDTPDWMPGISDLLKAMRLRRGLSLSEAAKQLGISTPTLSKYENGNVAPRRERLPDLFALFRAFPEEQDALTDHRFLLAEPYANTPDSLDRLEQRLSSLHQRIYQHTCFPGDLCFLALEAQIGPLAKQSRRALNMLLSCWTIHAEWLLWQGRVLEIDKYAERALEFGCSYHLEAEEHQARACEMMTRFIAHHPTRSQPAYAVELMSKWIDLPAHKHRITAHYRGMAEMAGYAGQDERALRYIDLSRREAAKHEDTGHYLLADIIEARIRIESGTADQGLALLTQMVHHDPGQQMLIFLLQAEALLNLGARNEAASELNRFFAHIDQYDLGSHRWKGNALARRLDLPQPKA